MTESIYLDGFATLPIAPEARRAMLDAMALPGNAASPHLFGELAAETIASARESVAYLIGASAAEIVFTSGATEANNLAIVGTARRSREVAPDRKRIVVSAVEHKAVLEPARALELEGFELVVAPVDPYGRLDLDRYADLLDGRVLLASIMAVNNETGMVQPVTEACAMAHEVGALFHCDAAQAAGKIPIDVLSMDIDYLSLSAHKCYGPMGIGALYVAATAPGPVPLQFGGGQQRGVRPGTEPVALVAGFGAAAAVAADRLYRDSEHGRRLADLLLEELCSRQVRLRLVTGDHEIVPGGLAVEIEGVDAESVCLRLARSVQLSTGSACTSGQLRTSHVLDSMGFSEARARSVMRMFCNRYLTDEDIVAAAAMIAAASQSAVATGEALQ